MKKLTYIFVSLIVLLIISGISIQAQTAIDAWGSIGRHGWPIILNPTPGNVGMGDTGNPPQGNWATVRGGFNPVTPNQTDAIVITGQIEFIGGGPTSWSALRYGIFRHDSAGTLVNTGTDSVRWSGLENNAYGYMFSPHSGTNDQVSGNGGNGTQWRVNGGSWISTFSGGTTTLGVVNQAPFRAVMSAGTYDWAFSIQPLGDGTNEVRWYMIKTDNSYWFGGTLIDSVVSTSFNGVVFGINNGNDIGATGLTEVQLTSVDVELGDPIEVPAPPFSPFYVDEFGSIGRHGWPILRDSTSLVGDAGMGGTGNPPQGNWATLRGGFGGNVEATLDEAIIVTGQIEFIGGGPTSWSALRYGLFRHDSAGTFINGLTDSARYNGLENNAYGYMFSPHSGTNDQVSGNGGNGTQWRVAGGSWISTFSGGTTTLGVVNQAPFRAVMTAGTYDWAISVQPLGDGTNEVRWYMIKEDNSYWFGGTVIDTSITTTFNGVVFGINNGNDIGTTGLTEVQLIAVHVDRGDPIEVPAPPFSPFYVDEFGSIGRHGWPILRDSTSLIGDAGMGGTGNPPDGNWATLRGGFGGNVEATLDEAIIVTGQIEFIGGGPTSWSALRYGLFRHDSAGTFINALTDSARYDGLENNAYGYMFSPHSGTNDQVSGNGGNGTQWRVVGGSWISTFSGGTTTLGVVNQAPARAEMTAGTYNWAISVQPLGNGTNEIRWYMIKEDTSYWFGGTVIDTSITASFNGVIFGINNGNDIGTTGLTEVQLIAVHVDRGDPIEVPDPPFESYYVDQWGFIGDRFGGWNLTPGAVIGNTSISGSAPNTDWAAVRGGFIAPVTATPQKAVVVTGSLEFIGGGFEGESGLRFGIFYSDSAGTIDSTANGYAWNGSEDYHSGYLFIPRSGTNPSPTWNGTEGTVGAVVNGTWFSTNVSGNYVLGNIFQKEDAVASSGTYDFEISVHPLGNGTTEVKCNLVKDNNSYEWIASVIDDNSPLVTETFNSVAFALNSWSGSTTTGLNILDVKVDSITITGVEEPGSEIPTVYALSQNYPNPFNPATTIEFSIPENSDVQLVIYDALGREVQKLISGNMNPGYHKINFNASNLASGIYFYRLTAGDFVSVKKLMLLK